MKCASCGTETERYCIYHYGYECEGCHGKKPLNKEPPDLVHGPRLPKPRTPE
ncbi:MAG: hypothetical protein JRN39_02500 [Nitrososphaerota archaeon]|nr:hypothetical protein [Nitrososphaerota archaeon]